MKVLETTKPYLGPMQKMVLDYITDHLKRIGFSPTEQEIAKALGTTRPNVQYHIRQLVQKGLVDKPQNQHRSLKIIGAISDLTRK